MAFKFIFMVLFYGLSLSPFSWAQENATVSVDVVAEGQTTLTQKTIFDRAIEKVSLQYVVQLIGEAKANENRGLIKNRILKNSGKYVLFIKAQNPVVQGSETHYGVSLKVSLKNLSALLLEEGLLYKNEGPPQLLPVLTVVDKINSQSFAWWSQTVSSSESSSRLLMDVATRFHHALRRELRSKGFFALDPINSNYKQLLPLALQIDSPSTEDLLLLADFFHSQILAKGQVVLSRHKEKSEIYNLEIRLAALHATNGRIIGEIVRSYETESGPLAQVVKAKIEEVFDKLAAELGSQMLETWKSGVFGASLLNIVILGDLSYMQLTQFKKLLVDQMKDLKSLKERFFEPGRVVLETDSAVNAEQLARFLPQMSAERFKVSVVNFGPDSVQIKVVPR